ncbi:aminotransferase [Mycobacteroides abscessus subsp. abscessus]|nr:aminotransferase [Mycobacteroides abscessus subsp. abscessus]
MGRARRVVAVSEPRLAMSLAMFSSAVTPPCMPMMTRCPSLPRASMFRLRYFAPMMSRIRSTPEPSVKL